MDAAGRRVFKIDRDAVAAIDPEKLKRWATIALTVLTFIEPFVPPPYNLAVHAAVLLLKAWLAKQDPLPQDLFPVTNKEIDWTAKTDIENKMRRGWAVAVVRPRPEYSISW